MDRARKAMRRWQFAVAMGAAFGLPLAALAQ
jgi:hypothetical protein